MNAAAREFKTINDVPEGLLLLEFWPLPKQLISEAKLGYHVSIIRTGAGKKSVSEEEAIPILAGKFGFTVERDDAGAFKQAFRKDSDEEVLFFFDDNELWTTNPSEHALGIMIDIANAFGDGARVRGDEGESYKSLTSTYNHPDDPDPASTKPEYSWAVVLPTVIQVIAIGIFICGVTLQLLKYFGIRF